MDWKVWDVYPSLQLATASSSIENRPQAGSYVDPAFANGWLCFDRRGERRRFPGIPPGWELWDADALGELCAKAVPNGNGAVEG